MHLQNNTGIKLEEKRAIRSAKFVVNVFNKHSVKYWFDYGALLGTIRDKKFISWDNDIEFYMFYKNDNDRLKIINAFKASEFELDVDMHPRKGVHIKEKDGHIGMNFSWFRQTISRSMLSKFFYYLPTCVRMQIIHGVHRFYSESKSDIIRPSDGEKREANKISCWVREFLPIFFCGKLMEADLYDFKVSVPVKAEELLYFRYGKDWRIPKQVFVDYTS